MVYTRPLSVVPPGHEERVFVRPGGCFPRTRSAGGVLPGVLKGWEADGGEVDVAGGGDEPSGVVAAGGGVEGAAPGEEEGAAAAPVTVRRRVSCCRERGCVSDGREMRASKLRRQEAQMLMLGGSRDAFVGEKE